MGALHIDVKISSSHTSRPSRDGSGELGGSRVLECLFQHHLHTKGEDFVLIFFTAPYFLERPFRIYFFSLGIHLSYLVAFRSCRSHFFVFQCTSRALPGYGQIVRQPVRCQKLPKITEPMAPKKVVESGRKRSDRYETIVYISSTLY